MGFNQKQFAEQAGCSAKTVKKWFDAGYLGYATRNERGIYDIPFDTPIPFSAKANVKNNSTLWNQFFLAAENNRSVFKSMFPHIPEDTYNRQLKELVDGKFIELITIDPGITQLSLKPAGVELLNQLSDMEKRKSILAKVNSIMITAGSTITLVQTLVSLGLVIEQIKPLLS